MPRCPRNFFKTSFFHVMTQGINKSFIFDSEVDIKYYIKTMFELKSDYKIDIKAYCVMNNHTHMLLGIQKIEDLSKFMLRLNSKYAKYYNKKYNRVGYVFRDRFKSEAIYDESHLYNCIDYIYNNPVKAGICKTPNEYKWSNYRPVKLELHKDYFFIDTEEDMRKTYKEIIRRFIIENNLTNELLIKDKKALRELVTILNKDYHLSLRRIADELQITREKLRRIAKS